MDIDYKLHQLNRFIRSLTEQVVYYGFNNDFRKPVGYYLESIDDDSSDFLGRTYDIAYTNLMTKINENK